MGVLEEGFKSYRGLRPACRQAGAWKAEKAEKAGEAKELKLYRACPSLLTLVSVAQQGDQQRWVDKKQKK